jgi:hypothetical protein
MAFQTSTNLYQNTKYVVDDSGGTPYATIQSAINAANAAGVPATIFIRAGSYTEDLTLYDGIELQGSNAVQTDIIGVHVPPAAGRCAFTGLTFSSATHVLSSAAAGTATITFSQCLFNLTDGYICNMTNWTGNILFEFCSDKSTVNGLVLNTATADVTMNNNTFGVGTTKSLTINGVLTCFNTSIGCRVALSGAAVSRAEGGCAFTETVTLSGNADFSVSNSSFSTGADTAIVTTSTVALVLSNVNIDTSNADAIDGTGTVQFISVVFADSKGLAATVVEDLTGVTKTGEIYADTVLRMDMTGFYSWAAAGPYFDDTTLGTFDLLVGGEGYIKGKLVTWAAQTYVGMTSGATWYIYIDEDGVIGATSTRTDALFTDYIVLFECLYDETTIGGAKLQHTVKENHPYSYQVGISNYQHHAIGTIYKGTGANITLVGPANVKISISGADELEDHGLETVIADTGGAGVHQIPVLGITIMLEQQQRLPQANLACIHYMAVRII